MRRNLLIGLALLAAACSAEDNDKENVVRIAAAEVETCIGCHERINPGLVAAHRASPHERIPLACEECHGSDHDQMFAVAGAVPPTVCARCHEEAYESMRKSRHGKRLREGKLDTLLLASPLPVGGCTATGGCHSIQRVYADGSVGRCSACHPMHAFSNAEARNPRVCIGCHGGIDHPQYEAWLKSSHSFGSPSGKGFIADCVECHGTHDVSDAIVHDMPPSQHAEQPAYLPVATREEFEAARSIMLARCAKCHTRKFAGKALELGDKWRTRGAAMLSTAADIVTKLHEDGLLEPPLRERPKNPVTGHGLRLGGAQIFDQSVSLPERIYYEMHFQLYPAMWRAAYHTDPERVVWELNDNLKTALDHLRDVDRELRRARKPRAQ
jgi:nitrate/TMAO reductase-like tetraheme cytochrome c subunit